MSLRIMAVVLVVACGARTPLLPDDCPSATRPCTSPCGTGIETCSFGEWSGCTAPQPKDPPATIDVEGTVRDFHDTHPDFEPPIFGDDRGLILPTLGTDGRPVYAPAGATLTVSGRASFDQWYRDVPTINTKQATKITLARTSTSPLLYTFENPMYFPIDGALFGNEGRPNNFHFTIELQTEIEYRGGEQLLFQGDDDLFVFIDGKLVLDLGGIHSTEKATISLDGTQLAKNKALPLTIFFAERHTSGSSLRIVTTNAHFVACPN